LNEAGSGRASLSRFRREKIDICHIAALEPAAQL
jgi:hypothetical protein